jgi:hypothetical protein
MSVKFRTNDRRVVDNIAETKYNPRKKWVVVATDGKKSYTTTIENALSLEAKQEAGQWAKRNGLRLEVVKVIK